MDIPSFDPKEFVAKHNRARKRELLELIDSNEREMLLSDEVWGFDVVIDAAGGIGYLKLTYTCDFDNGDKLYLEARVGGACTSLIGFWKGRGEMNVPPASLLGTQSDLQIIITPIAFETTFWAKPSRYQGICGGGGFGLTGCAGGGTGIWSRP